MRQVEWEAPDPFDPGSQEARFRHHAHLAAGLRHALDLWLGGRLAQSSRGVVAGYLELFATYLRRP